MGQFLVYLLFRIFEGVVSLLPIEWVFHVGQAAGSVGWLVAWPYRRLARGNLNLAFGSEASPAELEQLCHRHFRRLGANLLSSLKIPSLGAEEAAKRVTIDGHQSIADALARGRGIVYAVAHLGNWEILSQVAAFGPGTVAGTLYQPLGNPFLDARLVKQRSRENFRLFSRRDGFHAPVQHLRGNGVLGILVDQHAGDGGVWTPLFGRLASTTHLAALLSLRTGAPILPVAMITAGPGRWNAVVGPPITGEDDDPASLTAAMNVEVERMIRRAPVDWFWVHNRWKTPCPNYLLARYKRGVAFPAGFDAAQLKPFEILVRSPNWLGDACMALPAVRAIRWGRPDARVTVLAPARVADFWRMVPEVDAVIAKDGGGKPDSVAAVRRLIRESGTAYDAGVLLTGSPRSAFELAGLPRLTGFGGRWRKRLIDDQIPPPEPGPLRHHTHHFLRIAGHLGADLADRRLCARLEPPTPDSAAPAMDGPVLGLSPGAEYGPAKRWALENFIEVARRVAERTAANWTIFGTTTDKPAGAALSAALGGRARDLTGRTSLSGLAGELSRCRLLLTNDTGTMHLAAALDVPVVAVFGSTEPGWTGPLGDSHAVIRHHVDCSPCFHRECPLKTDRYRCFQAISIDEVVAAVIARLDVPPDTKTDGPPVPHSGRSLDVLPADSGAGRP